MCGCAGSRQLGWADYISRPTGSTSHGQWARTKNNILENKQLMKDFHVDPTPVLEVFPLNQITYVGAPRGIKDPKL